jgi:hypothetical protein
MKSPLLLTARRIAIILAFSIITFSASAQTKINDGTISGSSLPDNSALLELESNNKGLLLSRVSLSNTTIWGLAGSTPVAGMLVYNTNASITSSSTSYPIIQGGVGCYYWNGTGWVAIKMDISKSTADNTYWTVYGNASTNRSANFLGTTDNHPLVIKVNNSIAGYLDSSGGKSTTIFGSSAISQNLTATYTGSENTAIGSQALQNLTGGSWNTAVGKGALQALTTGNTNTAVGQFALGSTVNAGSNTAVGQVALGANTTGGSNTAVGQAALTKNTSGFNNLAIGASALLNNTTGSNNIAIGQDVGSTLIDGSNNILIGNSVNVSSAAANNTMNIGNTVYATETNAATRKVGVNQSAPNSTLQVGGSLSLPITSTANDLTLTDAHYTVLVTTAGNSAVTITLPAATGLTGRIYVIVNERNTGSVTVSSTTNIKIYSANAASSITIPTTNSYTFQSDGTNWHRIH